MRISFRAYFLWVLLPLGTGILVTHHLTKGRVQILTQASLVRMGGVATLLFTEEMGRRSAEIARTAPLLENPDLGSPVLQAAMRGDTVAALGMAGPDLVLSVALAVPEGAQGEPGLKAVTRPFLPTSLSLFHDRTGLGVALYLRGRRASASPADFGPPEIDLSATGRFLGAGAAEGLAVPLVSAGQGRAPAQLVVAFPGGPQGRTAPVRRILLLVAALVLAFGYWGGVGRGGSSSRSRPARLGLFGLVALPLGAFWIVLAAYGQAVTEGARDSQGGDRVRILGLLKEGPQGIEVAEVSARTGFHILRGEADGTTSTSIDDEELLARASSLPLPSDEVPVEGALDAHGERWEYAASREGGGGSLILLSRGPPSAVRNFLLVLFGLGGLVSLCVLGFLNAFRGGEAGPPISLGIPRYRTPPAAPGEE